jgi:hypothetical protein
MTLDASGQLGLGTTTPDIFGRGYTRMLTVNSSGSSAVQINAATGNTGWIDFGVNASRVGTIAVSSSIFELGTSGTVPLALFTNSNYRLYITSGGDVGIGTTAPSNLLHVSQASSDFQIRVTGTSAGNAGSLRAYNDGGQATGFGTTGSTNSGYGANLGFMGTITNIPQIFLTNNTERMRIDSAGNALFAKAVRATITTDNDLSFDMNAASNFRSTPTSGGALTFTNITSGQTGNIILVNGSNYAITAAATTKVSATCLATISATGTYWLSYYSDGTNVFVANTGALA